MFNLGQICQYSELKIRKPTYRHQPVLCSLIKYAVLANQSARYMKTSSVLKFKVMPKHAFRSHAMRAFKLRYEEVLLYDYFGGKGTS